MPTNDDNLWEEVQAETDWTTPMPTPQPMSPPSWALPPTPPVPIPATHEWKWTANGWCASVRPESPPVISAPGTYWKFNNIGWFWEMVALTPPPQTATATAAAQAAASLQPNQWASGNILHSFDAESYNPFKSYKTKQPEMKKKRKSKGEVEEPSDEPISSHTDGSKPKDWSRLLSIFDNRYNSTEEEWKFYKDIGWLHISEQYSFNEAFKYCSFSDRFWTNSEIRYFPPNGDGVQKSVCLEKVKELELVTCSQTSYVDYKDNFVEALDSVDKVQMLHKKHGGPTKECDYTHKTYIRNCLFAVVSSMKYKYVCNKVANNKDIIRKCTNCGKLFEAEMVKVYEGVADNSPICSTCHDTLKYKNAIYPWNAKTYPNPIYSVKERYGCFVNESDGMIYATNKKEPVKHTRLYGVEAEVELWKAGCKLLKLNRFEMAIRAREALGPDFVVCKEDGTLTMNGKYDGNSSFDPDGTKDGKKYAGFEIVTCPADLATHRDRWYRLANHPKLHYGDKNRSLLMAWDTTTCGFHVHVSRDALTTLQIGRILRFVNHPNNAKFIHKIAGRGSDVFCAYHEKEVHDVQHPDRVISINEQSSAHNRARRVAVNLCNEHTIEFRIFRGTIHPNHILRNLCFVEAVCDYCYPASRAISDMDRYDPFIQFVSNNIKTYQELAAWFVYQKHLSLKKIKDGVDVNKLTIHPDMVSEPDVVPIKKKSVSEDVANIISAPSALDAMDTGTF